MTERHRSAVSRTRDALELGPSSVRWEKGALVIDIVETGMPIPRRVRGQVLVHPEIGGETAFDLDPAARHRWHPIAPRARIEVDLTLPDLRWTGDAYLDSNFGDEPIARGFRHWNWSRAHLQRDVAVLYAGERRDRTRFGMALRCDRQGQWREAELPPVAKLPRTMFAMSRATCADAGTHPRISATWEDAPFYARSVVDQRLFGEEVRAVHESLALDRLDSAIVRHLLPWRMPRTFR